MLTEDKVIGIYCLMDDLLKCIHHSEDSSRRLHRLEGLFFAMFQQVGYYLKDVSCERD